MMDAVRRKPVIGIIGGTGALGSGLSRRWSRAGYSVIIGSRDPAKAREAARCIARDTGADVTGDSYMVVAAAADIVVLAVPFASQGEIVDAIRPALHGQIVIDTTVPLAPGRLATSHLQETGSAAVAARRRLGTAARVVSAFHNVPARHLAEHGPIDCDVLVFGDAAADREIAIQLVVDAGLRGIHGGPLANSIAAEAMTSVLIGINRQYQPRLAGIRITGLD